LGLLRVSRLNVNKAIGIKHLWLFKNISYNTFKSIFEWGVLWFLNNHRCFIPIALLTLSLETLNNPKTCRMVGLIAHEMMLLTRWKKNMIIMKIIKNRHAFMPRKFIDVEKNHRCFIPIALLTLSLETLNNPKTCRMVGLIAHAMTLN
jgi:hypothetical protein